MLSTINHAREVLQFCQQRIAAQVKKQRLENSPPDLSRMLCQRR